MFTPRIVQDEQEVFDEADMSDIAISFNQVFDLVNTYPRRENIRSIRNESIKKFQINFAREIQSTQMTSNSDKQEVTPNVYRCYPVTTDFDQFQSTTLLSPTSNFPQTMDFASPPSGIDSAILRQSIPFDEDQPTLNVLISNRGEVHANESRTVSPILYSSNTNIIQTQNISLKFTKIQIKSQPRERFRPRTQNESKNSSHYLRCDNGAEHEHPTISVPPEWTQQSDTNIIEVALMDIEKQPHPYTLENKSRQQIPDDKALIFKENADNTLYFRLTNEDFVRGFKTFMIEFIKRKQDEEINKKVIQSRNLDQSRLRFTRIYRDAGGKYQRDTISEEYSCIMTENYGDVTVEHMGPRFGPMIGQEMIFIVIKGRFIKKEISITITEPTTNWNVDIDQFSTNGGLIYFPMPNFPHPQSDRVNATIHISFKQDKIYEASYLYTNLLDRELAECNFDIAVSPTASQMNQFQFDMLSLQSPPSRRLLKTKPPKRLDGK